MSKTRLDGDMVMMSSHLFNNYCKQQNLVMQFKDALWKKYLLDDNPPCIATSIDVEINFFTG